jgi:hypothetical protein
MHEDVDSVIGERIQSPERVLQPETCQCEGIVNSCGGCPDLSQSQRADNVRVGGDMCIIVPDKVAVQRAPVRRDDEQGKQ